MQARAAIMRQSPGSWEVVDVEVDDPGPHEVRVRYAASGLCHSDDHLAQGDALSGHYPVCGGHEAAGVIEAVGAGVLGLREGDHIVTSFIPGCGRCRWCASGMQNLCDNGARMLAGAQLDGGYRMHHDGEDVGQLSFLGTFSERSVIPEWGAVKIAPDIPLAAAALVGCAVPTGWGSAVNAANASPGDTVIVMGVGGVGINAVQGAAYAGALNVIAVDPVAFKREVALKVGATLAVASIAEATELALEMTGGQGADAVIITIGVVSGQHVGDALSAIRKGGTVVVTGVAPMTAVGAEINLAELTLFQKRVQGALYGMMAPSRDIPRLLELYRHGRLNLDDLATTTYRLEDVNQGYADLHAGRNIRGLISFD